MSDAQQMDERQDVENRIRRNVRVLLASGQTISGADVSRALHLSRQALSARLASPKPGHKPTRFTIPEIFHLADLLGVTVDELRLPTEALLTIVGKRQNWKEKNCLRSIDGGGKVNGQGRFLFSTSA